MRKAAVRHGDPTTTRGFVMAYSSTIHDDGKKVALSSDEATCGNCKGTFKIFGTGKGMSEQGRDVVVEGDLVLCPCKKNRVIAGSNPGIFLNTGGDAGTDAGESNSAQAVATKACPYASLPPDELKFVRRIFVWDATTGNPTANRAFVAEIDGKMLSGKTDGQGYATIKTEGEQPVNIHILFSSPRRDLRPRQET
ncbi:putative Zn-binding protein involved in type VI secretion [Paraburkholderia sp. GAS333]|uniref:PAAR domain-containing protein n=1 Tax=Paraburkholderia sp. GAS333 TaxID=3156279 RepID=UPI003D19D441